MTGGVVKRANREACPSCNRNFGTQDALIQHHKDRHGSDVPGIVAVEKDILQCVECESLPALTNGRAIYPRRPDLWHNKIWQCACGAYVGCHGITERPLGRPAGPETRRARMVAHAAFDPLWMGKGNTARRTAYDWLAMKMGLATKDCHIGHMSREQALAVVRHVRAKEPTP